MEHLTRPARAVVRSAVLAALSDLVAGDRVLVAVSGGPDSLALCSAAVHVGRSRGLVVEAVVVDHGLQTDSGAVAHRACQQALRLGCQAADVVRVHVGSGPGSGGPEAAARHARYSALARSATDRGAACVLLGHTRDDQAESVLLGLARGSGTRSIAGMAARSDPYRRPLLEVPREIVAEAAAADFAEDPSLEPWSDPHNADPAYLRVRVRTRLLPALEQELGHGVRAALARTAQMARDDADALDDWAGRELSARLPAAQLPGSNQLLLDDLAGLPRAVRTRVIRQFLIASGCPADAVGARQVNDVERMVLSGPRMGPVALPGRRHAHHVGDRLDVRT